VGKKFREDWGSGEEEMTSDSEDELLGDGGKGGKGHGTTDFTNAHRPMRGGSMSGGSMNGRSMHNPSMNGQSMNGRSTYSPSMNSGPMSGGSMNGGSTNNPSMNGGSMTGLSYTDDTNDTHTPFGHREVFFYDNSPQNNSDASGGTGTGS
jgi:hypothetical protein